VRMKKKDRKLSKKSRKLVWEVLRDILKEFDKINDWHLDKNKEEVETRLVGYADMQNILAKIENKYILPD